MNHTIFVKQKQQRKGIKGAEVLFYHQFRQAKNQRELERENPNAIWRFRDRNLYIDKNYEFTNAKEAYNSSKIRLFERTEKYREYFEWREFGHHSLEIDELKKIVLEKDEELFLKNDDLKKEFESLEEDSNIKNRNISVFKFLNKYKKLGYEFEFKFKKPVSSVIDRRRTWEEFLDGRVWKKDTYNKTTMGQGKTPAFVTDFQVHLSRDWFEKMGWVEYLKTKTMDRDLNLKDENILIKEIKDPEALKKWF